ncbi:hypothetical protein GPX89_29455 [Nocardia sp. ET3-3]|uniref:Uncharacterized protein n=1 Tax=Nocardia terrae TaxID=2675851 RepID=A0A7K1V4A6_9NOCA|nr:hypothetical protein [Nocardia terrae]MVU81357.1 hypothetical protein [Nocardia terrae]
MRTFTLARLGLGAVYALVSQRISERTTPPELVAALRVLAARHIVQAALTSRRPALTRLGVTVDALHALSMFTLAVADRSYRRPALADALIATVLTGSGFVLTRPREISADT